MENISTSIITFMESVPEYVQLILLFAFSFGEGLPVIGSILPGGTIAIFAGSLAEEGILSPILTSMVIGVGSFIGDMTGFFIGKKFKNISWIKKIVENEKHSKKWDLFDRHVALISIFGKLIPGIRSTPAIFAGVRGIKIRKYILYSFIGSLLWALAGVYAGKIFTNYFGEKAIPFIFGIIVLSIIIVIIRQPIKSFRKKKIQ